MHICEHGGIAYCNETGCRIARLEFHKGCQIDENRKVSRRIDELEAHLKSLTEKVNKNILAKLPFKCPICDGKGGFYITGTRDSDCVACNGTAIVWG